MHYIMLIKVTVLGSYWVITVHQDTAQYDMWGVSDT
jgi:hypothetical protein